MSSVVLSGDSSGTITLQAPAVSGSTTINLPATSGTATVMPSGYTLGAGNTSSFKNRIINGDMRIDQRNAGASVSISAGSQNYTLDRWTMNASQSSKFTIQQNAGSVTPPVGFSNYLGATSSSSYSIGASEFFDIFQPIEGFNFADMGWGTANAKTVTLSFQIRSSLTGTFSGYLINASGNRCYNFSYTISSANTWTAISITVAGDTTGTWVGSTNGVGIYVVPVSLGAGSSVSTSTTNTWGGNLYRGVTGQVNMVSTNGATVYITGVQLEIGSQATSFDVRPYGTELALCLRYYEVASSIDASGYVQVNKQAYFGYTIYPKRTSATIAAGSYSNQDNCSSLSTSGNDGTHVNFYLGGNNGNLGYVRITSAKVTFSAEL